MFGLYKIYNVWKNNRDYTKAYAGKSKMRQLIEILYYRLHGFSAFSYFTIPLYNEFMRRPLVSERKYNKIEKHLNPRRSGVIPFNKWVQSCFWKANGLPHVKTYGFILEYIGMLNNRKMSMPIEDEELTTFFISSSFPMVIKPIDGANGAGFDIIDSYDSATRELFFRERGRLHVNHFMKALFTNTCGTEGYIFQEYIKQHRSLDLIFPNSVNTLRVVTHVNKQGEISVDCALIKFGTGTSITDNNSNGRLVAFIDLNDGSLKDGFTGILTQDKVKLHPDTRKEISGCILPFWEEAIELAKIAHVCLPFPRHLGWDIAITENGPLIVEMNSFLAISAYQKAGNDLTASSGFGQALNEI